MSGTPSEKPRGIPSEKPRAMAGGELLYDLPANLQPLDAVRGSMLFFHWTWLRANKRYDDYAARIEAAHRDAILGVTTSDWVPLDVALAHYRALDGAGLSRQDAFDAGCVVGKLGHGTLLATILRLAGGLGVSPWQALARAHKMWERQYRGGGIAVHRVTDRSARVESVRNLAAVSPFHRAAVTGSFSIGIASLCKVSRIEEVERARTKDSFTFTIDWA